MPKLSPREYQDLKSFLAFFSQRFFDMKGLAPEQRPISLLEATELRAPAKAAEGLRMAINDCLEMSSHWAPDRVRELDAELRQHQLVTLSELRKRYSRGYARIVRRGRITSQVEYYMAKGIFDGGALELKESERHLLATMLQQYEERAS